MQETLSPNKNENEVLQGNSPNKSTSAAQSILYCTCFSAAGILDEFFDK